MSYHRWVKEAADYARAVADNTEQFGYTNVHGGGWQWEDQLGE